MNCNEQWVGWAPPSLTFSCLNPVKSRVVSTGTQEKAQLQESMPAVSMISASPLFLSLLVKQKKAARKRINQKHVFLSAVCRVPKAPRWTLAGEDTPQSSMGLQRGGGRAAHREAARKPSRSGYLPVSLSCVYRNLFWLKKFLLVLSSTSACHWDTQHIWLLTLARVL